MFKHRIFGLIFLSVFFSVFSSFGYAQQWAKTYGGSGSEEARSIQQTSDGGYVAAGWTDSFAAARSDVWILKVDIGGNIVWQKTYGGSDYDYAYSIQQTSDGGFIAAGWTMSFGAGGADAWILKLNTDGTIAWQKTYGGASNDFAYSVQETSDGGYIVAGNTQSFGRCGDAWVFKLDSNGTVIWQKTYGDWSCNPETANSIHQTLDGGYIVAGNNSTFDNWGDVWVLKLDSNGSVMWQKVFI